MAAATKEKAADSAVMEVEPQEAFYHFGLLPATGQVIFPTQEKDQTEMTVKPIGTAWDVFNSPGKIAGLDKNVHIFVAKARQYFGLAVRELHFPSTNEFVEMGETATNRSTYVGGVALLDSDKLKRIIRSCYRHVLRFPNGFLRMDDPMQTVEIVDLDFGSKPSNMTDAEWATYKAHNNVPQQPTFQRKTDKPIAEFVYLRKLDVELDPNDIEDYRKNPNRFHYQWLGPVTRNFFESPYKSVAETWPAEKMGG